MTDPRTQLQIANLVSRLNAADRRIAVLEAEVTGLRAVLRDRTEIPPLAQGPKAPSLDEILMRVSVASGFSVIQLKSHRRSPPLVEARQLFMHLAGELGYTNGQIGRWLGRDASTVWHGRRAHEERISGRPGWRREGPNGPEPVQEPFRVNLKEPPGVIDVVPPRD